MLINHANQIEGSKHGVAWVLFPPLFQHAQQPQRQGPMEEVDASMASTS